LAISEPSRFHLAWIAPTFCAVVVAIIAASTGIEMIPLLILIAVGWALSLALISVISDFHERRSVTVILVICTTIVFGIIAIWDFKENRPLLNLQIYEIVTRDIDRNPKASGLQLEVSIVNDGRQSSFVKQWALQVKSPSMTLDGEPMVGQKPDPRVVSLPDITDEEFPPGKNTHGWLTFSFAFPHSDLMKIFSCSNPSSTTITLSAVDSKTLRRWSVSESPKELIDKHGCTDLPPLVQPAPNSPETKTPQAQVGRPPIRDTRVPPTAAVSAPNGIAITGGSVTNPTVNNYAPPKRELTEDQVKKFEDALSPYCPFAIAVRGYVGDEDSMQYADQFKKAVTSAGCTLARPMWLRDDNAAYGIWLVIKDADNVPKGANELVTALGAAGINAKTMTLPFIKPNDIYLAVTLNETRQPRQ
jgi:hypothetical protein